MAWLTGGLTGRRGLSNEECGGPKYGGGKNAFDVGAAGGRCAGQFMVFAVANVSSVVSVHAIVAAISVVAVAPAPRGA